MQNTSETSGSVIAQEIKNRIIESVYVSGQKIRESDICKEFGISRTPVREAFRLLQNEGLLVHLPQRGVQVAEFGNDELMSLQEVRTALECISAKHAALCATKEQIAHLRALNKQIGDFDAADSLKTGDLDKELHLYIAGIGNNTYVPELLENVLDRFRISRYVIPFRESRISHTCKEHEDIISALEQNDPVLAEEYMKIHFYRSTQSLSYKIQEYNEGIVKEKKKQRKNQAD